MCLFFLVASCHIEPKSIANKKGGKWGFRLDVSLVSEGSNGLGGVALEGEVVGLSGLSGDSLELDLLWNGENNTMAARGKEKESKSVSRNLRER